MPLNIDSYTTTVGSSVNAQRIVKAIEEAIVHDDLDKRQESALGVEPFGEFHPLFITGTYPSEEKIPSFAHPISILNIRGKNFICSDLRLFLKKDPELGVSRRIQNRVDFDYAISRTILNLFWAGGRSGEFTSGFGFAAKVFAEWVAQVLRGSLGIEPHEQLLVQINAMAYYYSLCNAPYVTIEDNRQQIIDWVVNFTGLPDREVSSVLENAKNCRSFKDLVENLKLTVDNIRVQKLTEGAFIAAIRSSWYGVNADQVLAVCVEHPPTWTAIVYHTLNSKSYQRCLIAQVALKAGKRGDADAFMRHYHTMFGVGLRLENFKHVSHEATDYQDFNYNGLELSMEAAKTIPIL